jgi:flagellar biosynthesis anti-sigma factor FlgM
MAIKNVTSSPAGNSPLTKANDNDNAKANQGAAAVAGLGSPASVAQAAQNINQANKNFGVELSEKGKARVAERKKAFDIAKNTPDIREDKVADIKARLAAGTYEVDSGKIADGMLREALMEHLATSKDN